MQPTVETLAAAVSGEAGKELDAAARAIEHCLGQLDDAQVWWRPDESMNSIANLMLHLCGNLRQWIVAGVGGAEDVRRRPEEFAQREPIAREELSRCLEQAVDDSKAALRSASAAELLRTRRIQGFDVTGVQAIFQSVAHFRGHTQEIIHMTRSQLGGRYRMKFVPATPEQGAETE